MSLRDLLTAKIEEHAQELVDCFLAAIHRGDWRAAEAFITRVYGRPTERVELDQSLRLDEFTAEQRAALRATLVQQFPRLRLVPPAR